MTHALFFTAYDRADYLRQTLSSWRNVRGLDRWHIVARVEPGPRAEDMCTQFRIFFETMGLTDTEIIVNPTVYGVLHHPYVGFSELFQDYDFVVRTEDDLIVSDDILEYFEWAEETYRRRRDIATIHGFSRGVGENDEIYTIPEFNPWVWGTWKSLWMTTIGPLWDHNYSTFNRFPGFQSGWDWNLNTRLFPKYGYRGVYPLNSRVDNIGVYGVHGSPDNHEKAEFFDLVHGTVVYRELAIEKVDIP